MSGHFLISLITFTPLLGGLALLTLKKEEQKLARIFAISFSLVPAIAVLALWNRFSLADANLQFVERHQWIPSLGIEYFLGIDGLGLLMFLLTAIVIPFALSSTSKEITNPKLHFALYLFLQTGLYGTFTALNFFHWVIFWELSLVPAFFLIKLWGGPDRTRAAYQFFVYTLVGSVAMLLAFLAIYSATGIFDFIRLAELARSGELHAAVSTKLIRGNFSADKILFILFLGVLLGFAVKVPLFPFHTWLPATYAEAPSSVSMTLTGVMSKMGVYGFLRILLPIFPEQMRAALTPLLWLAVATIIFSAYAALAQKDLKRIIAYSSINHLGYCLLGLFAVMKFTEGDLLNEKAAALFCFVGILEKRSGGIRGLNDFGGLRKVAPVFCGLMGISIFSSLGLPGLNGFVGEFLIFKGVFSLASWAAALSTLGLLVTAIFLLTILQKVFSGPVNSNWRSFSDLTRAELLTVVPAIALMFGLGIFPQILIGVINPTVLRMVKMLNS
ncbi:MAG: NADH-quinone oxidoreductase subunit M [Verrucomicrobiota bacterium]